MIPNIIFGKRGPESSACLTCFAKKLVTSSKWSLNDSSSSSSVISVSGCG